MSLFQIMKKTKNLILPAQPPCFNQATERHNKRLSHKQGSQKLKKFISDNNILMDFSHQINIITPTIVFINLMVHKYLILIVNYGFIIWFYYMVLYLTEIDKLTLARLFSPSLMWVA